MAEAEPHCQGIRIVETGASLFVEATAQKGGNIRAEALSFSRRLESGAFERAWGPRIEERGAGQFVRKLRSENTIESLTNRVTPIYFEVKPEFLQ